MQNCLLKIAIDHFHYNVTRAKVPGSCSKDRAHCRAIVGKCQKISRSAMFCTKLCARLLCKFKEMQRGDFWVFLDKRGFAKSVVNEHCNGKLFFQILDTECVAGKRVWQCANIISLMRKRIEGEEGVLYLA